MSLGKIVKVIVGLFLKNSAYFFITLLTFIGLLLFYLDFRLGIRLYDVVVELHGLLFDIIFLGILLSIYEFVKSKKEERRKLEIEIELIRISSINSEKENSLSDKIRYLILQLNDIEISNLYFAHSNFDKISFFSLNLSQSTFWEATLNNCDFSIGKLKKIKFDRARINFSSLDYSDCSNSSFYFTKLNENKMIKANFSKSDFQASILKKCLLYGSDFSNCKLNTSIWIENRLGNNNFNDAIVSKEFFENLKNNFGFEDIYKNYCLQPMKLEDTDLFLMKAKEV